jgi:hypothetical protein
MRSYRLRRETYGIFFKPQTGCLTKQRACKTAMRKEEGQ